MKNKLIYNVKMASMASRVRLEVKPAPLTYNISAILGEIGFLPPLQGVLDQGKAWARVVYSQLKSKFSKQTIDHAIMFENAVYSGNEPPSSTFDTTISYLSVIRAFIKIFQDRYNEPDFEIFRVNEMAVFRKASEVIFVCTLQACERHLEVRYAECQSIHSAFLQGNQAPVLSTKNLKRVDELYRDIEVAYQCANSLFIQQADVEQFATYRYRFLWTHIEAMISRVRFIKKNKKAYVGDTLRCYEEIKAVSVNAGGVVSDIDLLDLRARIALNLEGDTAIAMQCSNEIDFHLNTRALDLDIKDEDLVNPFCQNTLLKLAIYVKDFESRKVMHLPELFDIVNTLLSAREVITRTTELIQFEFFMLTERILTYLVAVTCTFLNASKVGVLNDYSRFTDRMLQLLDAYLPLLPQYRSRIIQEGCETHRDRLVQTKQQIEEKIASLIREDIANHNRHNELQAAIEKYNAEFDNMLKQFESEAKQNPPKHMRHKKPRFTLPSIRRAENSVIEVSAPEPEPEPKPSVKSVAECARDYFDSVAALEDIEKFVDQVSPEARSEALLYIGDEYLLNLWIGSALTFYERALDEHGYFLVHDQELLTAIELSLSYASSILAKQIEYGEFYRNKAKADRDNFIISLGLKVFMRDKSNKKKLDLRDPEIREQLLELGLPIFQKIGKQK